VGVYRTNRKVVPRQVAKTDRQDDAVANGLEALEAMTRHSYALVLMDCQMPVMDGFAATTELRKREEQTRHTPIIALTAMPSTTSAKNAWTRGWMMAKPVNVALLISLVVGGERSQSWAALLLWKIASPTLG
jgi:CheY-like chemotaxis protein